MFTRRPIPIGTYEGRGALWSFNGYSRWVPYCAAFNHTGQPAASVPIGFTPDGFPLAVQLVGRAGRRGDAALARGADRAGAPVGRPRPGRLDVTELVALAERIAREAGAQLRDAFSGGALATETKSSPTDLVSEADVAAEKLIREALLSARPDDGMLGEEGSDTPGTSGLRWIVDPLDGTTNFLFGIPQWGVSIAVEDESGTLAGVVFDPMRDECWAAARGAEPTLNGEPLRRPRARGWARDRARRAPGFGYDADVRAAQAAGVTRLLPRVRDIRRAGSCAIDLAWTAAGRYDAYYERGVKLWDIAAGELICAQRRGSTPGGSSRRRPPEAASSSPRSRSRTSSRHWSTDCDPARVRVQACSSAPSSASASCSSSSPSCSRVSRVAPSAAARR